MGSYNGLVDIGYPKHYRVDDRDNKFSNGRSHINGIESFWSFAKKGLQKFNGVHRENFNLHLKKVSLSLITGIKICISCC